MLGPLHDFVEQRYAKLRTLREVQKRNERARETERESERESSNEQETERTEQLYMATTGFREVEGWACALPHATNLHFMLPHRTTLGAWKLLQSDCWNSSPYCSVAFSPFQIRGHRFHQLFSLRTRKLVKLLRPPKPNRFFLRWKLIHSQNTLLQSFRPSAARV